MTGRLAINSNGVDEVRVYILCRRIEIFLEKKILYQVVNKKRFSFLVNSLRTFLISKVFSTLLTLNSIGEPFVVKHRVATYLWGFSTFHESKAGNTESKVAFQNELAAYYKKGLAP